MKTNEECRALDLYVVCTLFCLCLTTILIAGCAAVTSTWANPKQHPNDPPGQWDHSHKASFWMDSPSYQSRAGLAYYLPEGKIHIHAVRMPILITNYGMAFIKYTNIDGAVFMLTNSVSISEFMTNSTNATNITLSNPPQAAPITFVSSNISYGTSNMVGPAASNVPLKLTAQLTIPNVVTNAPVTLDLASNSLATTTTFSNQTMVVTNGTMQPPNSTIVVSSYTKVTTTQPFVSTNFFYNITVSVDYQADSERLFLLRPQLNWFRDDSPSVTIDGNGLLSTINASNNDQTANVVVALGETAVQSFMLASGVPPIGSNPLTQAGPNPFQARFPNRIELNINLITLPNLTDFVKSMTELVKATTDFMNTAANYSPNPFTFPQIIDVSFDPFDTCDLKKATDELYKGGLTFLADSRFTDARSINHWSNWTKWKKGAQEETSGVFYRPVIPYTVSIRDLADNQVAATVLLPNKAPIINLPLDTAPFVSVISQVTFTNGLLGSYSVSKPSSALALAQCPLVLISDITSSITNLLQLRINLGTSQNALQNLQYSNQAAANAAYITQQNAQLAVMTNQLQMILMRQALSNAQPTQPH